MRLLESNSQRSAHPNGIKDRIVLNSLLVGVNFIRD